MTTIGFLHTSPVHVPTFRAIVAEALPSAGVVDVVDESLLDQARGLGGDAPEAVAGSERAVTQLQSAGAELIVCTCSTIGGIVERVGADRATRVIRVDRPMAELAIATGERIAVVAAVESTLGPTLGLLESVAAAGSAAPTIEVHLIAGAWDLFEAGDIDGYVGAIAAALPVLAVDVIVLAQASMAPAADLVSVDCPVLASPQVFASWLATRGTRL